ncbi:MAG: DUF2520 domain-containing protein [Dehalococcoidia bacterium]
MQASNPPRIGFIGAGRLGSSLAVALTKAGYQVTAIASRDPRAAAALASNTGGSATVAPSVADVLAMADLVFLTVPDGAIAQLAAMLPWRDGHLAVHCSGALGLDVLQPVTRAGGAAGCLHPVQSFPERVPDPARFEGIFCGVEGAEPLGALLERLAADMGARAVRLEGVNRALYHAAAVFASNDAVALLSAACRTWALAGLAPDLARPALVPLTQSVIANLARLELPAALTGPIARGDVDTVRRHLDALAIEPALHELYRVLGRELLPLASCGPEERAALARLLDGR